MGQKWPDATVRSHAVLVGQNKVHHWDSIENPVLAVWLSCYIILCILSEGKFDVISRIFPDSTTSKCPGRCAAGNRKLPGSILGWSLSTWCYSLHFCTFSMSPGPDFQSDSNGTTHLIFRKHPGKIFVYSCLSPAIKVAIWDQLGLYCYQSLLPHTLSLLPGPDFNVFLMVPSILR